MNFESLLSNDKLLPQKSFLIRNKNGHLKIFMILAVSVTDATVKGTSKKQGTPRQVKMVKVFCRPSLSDALAQKIRPPKLNAEIMTTYVDANAPVTTRGRAPPKISDIIVLAMETTPMPVVETHANVPHMHQNWGVFMASFAVKPVTFELSPAGGSYPAGFQPS